MKVLFTTPILEHPAAGGPQLRIENTIKALSPLCELDIICRAPREAIGGEAGEKFYRDLCSEFRYAPSAPPPAAGNRYLRKLRSLIVQPGSPTERSESELIEEDAEFLLDQVAVRVIDVVWFGYGNISFPLIKRVKQLRPDLKVVCDTDSVWSRFVLRELPFQQDPDKREDIRRKGQAKEREEREWVDLCEITTAVSEVDAEYYRDIATDPSRVCLLSNVIDLASYEVAPPPAKDLESPCMYLSGTFGRYDSPMDVAARWVLEEVLPRVRKEIPNIRFYIVGNGSDRGYFDASDPAVIVEGKVPSVLPYLCHVDVALVPLKFESGTRFKILEAGACGTPLVSTALGAEGIPVVNGEHLLLADDPDAFSEAVVRLIRDKELAKRLAANCRDLVKSNYSIQSLSRQAGHILGLLQ